MHYAIGDVHGCYDDLMAMIDIIEKKDPDARFIFVGDFVDRGPKVYETIQWMMDHITEDGKYQSVCGNHEDQLISWFTVFVRWWYLGRTDMPDRFPGTYYDFDQMLVDRHMVDVKKVAPIINFFQSLPVEKSIKVKTEGGELEYKIVHAWYPPDPSRFKSQEEFREYCIWERPPQFQGNPSEDYIIIHGHTPTITSYMSETAPPGMIGYRENAINIDGGCTFSHMAPRFPCMLCGICLETLEEIYPYTLEERFKMINPDISSQELEAHVDWYEKTFLQYDNPYREAMVRRCSRGQGPEERQGRSQETIAGKAENSR